MIQRLYSLITSLFDQFDSLFYHRVVGLDNKVRE